MLLSPSVSVYGYEPLLNSSRGSLPNAALFVCSQGRTIRKVMGGVGNFQPVRFLFSLTACTGFFQVKPSARIFFQTNRTIT